MSTKDFAQYKKAADALKKEVSGDKDKAIDFLKKIGVLTKAGNVTKDLKGTCIPQKQG